MHPGSHDFDDQKYFDHPDDGGMGHAEGTMDFAAAMLAQHNAEPAEAIEHEQDAGHVQSQGPGGDGGGQSASDTAAAAMAQYHTMRVPQSTEQSFLAQAAESNPDRPGSSSVDAGGAQPRTSSYGDLDFNGMKNDQAPANGTAGR